MNTTFIDTHCHLNFKRFKKDREDVILRSKTAGITGFIVPGTDIPLSETAVEIAVHHEGVYAAIGIHPHHTFNIQTATNSLATDIDALRKLVTHPKVVAIGEIGLDKHEYEDTKYPEYHISEAFMNAQIEYFIAQLTLAKIHGKALIIHNRETKKELLDILQSEWDESMRFRTVFHCSEPDRELLSFAKAHDIYIGVDGDVTYGGEKASYVREVPLEMLVLETDSPFFLPEPLKTQKLYPNTPANIPLIAQYISDLKGMSVEEVAKTTTRNAKRLFKI